MKILCTHTLSRQAELQSVVQSIREQYLRDTCVVFFQGPVGAGKTTTVTELLHQYGVGDDVQSPTYNYVFIHQGTAGEYAHFDCYRLELGDFAKKGLIDYASDESMMCLVEWSEHLSDEEKDCFSGDQFIWDIQIEDDKRVITLYER